MTEAEQTALETSPLWFCEEVIRLPLYDWQGMAVSWFEACHAYRVKGSVCSPNGAGKDDRIIAGLALWWTWIHLRGRVVITSKDSRQIDEQTYPALEKHRGKLPGWKFVDRYVETPTGGKIILFTTDEPGRAEGWHKEDDLEGPLLIIVNEAKSVGEEIFQAFDRCTYNGLLYVSSAGKLAGRFYESQFNKGLGFKSLKVGLKDCPHIGQDRINDIIATYGPDHPFTRSTLHGEFMEAEGESRFDRDGLDLLLEMGATEHQKAERLTLEEQHLAGLTVCTAPTDGWLWCSERPMPGARYIAFADPNTGVQSEGSKDRDNTAAGVLRAAYTDQHGTLYPPKVVAVLHADDGVKWDMDIVAERLSRACQWYGGCLCIVEANNYGGELLRLLSQRDVRLWKREARHAKPGKKLKVNGFYTTVSSKQNWVGALALHIREQNLVCGYQPACREFSTFIIDESGNGSAQEGTHDDWVSGIGLGLFALPSATPYVQTPIMLQKTVYPGVTIVEHGQAEAQHGACA